MADEDLIFGVSAAIYADFVRIFEKYPGVEKVLVFGSRAKGTSKPASDIDLAVIAPSMSDAEFSRLWNELDDLPLVFKLDVLHWDRLEDGVLRLKISEQGRVFYPQTAN